MASNPASSLHVAWWKPYVEGAAFMFVCVGFVWIGAMLYNPEFTSGTIWFLAFSLGAVANLMRVWK